MARLRFLKLMVGAWFTVLLSASAAPDTAEHAYPSSFRIAFKIGTDLYETLDDKFQKSVYPEPIQLETMDAPVITPVEGNDDDKVVKKVSVSAGYIDLINHIAHAKAIDKIQPGFFTTYMQNLSKDNAAESPPKMVDPRFWTDDVMNDQISYFNQMIGMTLAINLSHHYYGHYAKYANQMLAGKLVPINNFITKAEWDVTVKAAALNALNSALGTDGIKALFEAIGAMQTRPAWTAFIVPPAGVADLKKLNSQLGDYEKKFFKGGLKL